MSLVFAGLRAAITGGASGIGLRTGRLLAEGGAQVAALDPRVSEDLDPLLGIRCDVRDDGSVRAAIAQIVARFGGLDILINNAGFAAPPTIADNGHTGWHDVLDVNVVGTARVTRAALPHLRRSPHAAIVNTAASFDSAGIAQRAVRSATKGAVQALTLAMAADHVVDGIRVNCVEAATALEAGWPTRPRLMVDEIAHTIVYLASPLSASTTGSVLGVGRRRLL